MVELSIIIPCYNSEKYICELLDSIKIKNIPKYEIIIIDDGSTDNTLQVVKKYIKTTHKESTCTVASQHNQGVSAARNKGLELASGKLISFLDSDDMVADGYFDVVYELFSKDTYLDVICCYRSNRIDDLKGLVISTCNIEVIGPNELLRKYTYSKKYIVFPCFVYRSSIIKNTKILFSTNLKYGEDWEFVTKVLCHCKKALLIKNVAYWYRVSAFSATRNVTWRQTDAIIAAQNTIEYLRENNIAFLGEFSVYLYPRAVLSVLHRFSSKRNFDLFEKTFRLYYNEKQFIGFLSTGSDIKSKIAVVLLIISYRLFYFLVR